MTDVKDFFGDRKKDEKKKGKDDGFEEFYNPIGVTRTWDEWANDRQLVRPRGFVRDDILVRTEVSMIFGQSGAGKSFFATLLGLHIARGFPLHKLKTTKGRIHLFSQEMTPAAVRQRCNLMLPQESGAILADSFVISAQTELHFKTDMLNSQKLLIREIKAAKTEFVIIDSLADVVEGADENSNQEMGSMMRGIRSVARATGAHIMMIHHKGKAGQDGVDRGHRGASVLRDVCEATIEIKNIGGPNGRPISLVTFQKTRHATSAAPAPFTFEMIETDRMINIADQLDPGPVMRRAVDFEFGDVKASKSSKIDTLLRKTREAVGRLADSLGWATYDQLVDTFAKEKIRRDYVVAAVRRGVEQGVFEVSDDRSRVRLLGQLIRPVGVSSDTPEK